MEEIVGNFILFGIGVICGFGTIIFLRNCDD